MFAEVEKNHRKTVPEKILFPTIFALLKITSILDFNYMMQELRDNEKLTAYSYSTYWLIFQVNVQLHKQVQNMSFKYKNLSLRKIRSRQ